MKENTILTDRLYLDIVKGIAIFFMLWGHCIQYCTNGEFNFFKDSVFRLIYTFHMPLFMVVSGYLFYGSCQKRSFSALLVHRTQSMLQPIIMCNMLYYYLTAAIYERDLYYFISAGWIMQLDRLWFLWSVLACSTVLILATKATSKKLIQLMIILMGFGIVCLFPNWSQNLLMYPHFLIGFLFARYKSRLSKTLLSLRYLFLVVFPILIYFYFQCDYTFTNSVIIGGGFINNALLTSWEWVLGISGSVFILVLIESIYRLFICKKPVIAKPLSLLGLKSLQIYCVSVAVLSYLLPRLFSKFCALVGGHVFAGHMWIYDFVFTPCLAIFYAFMIYWIVKLMEKLRISRILFGR